MLFKSSNKASKINRLEDGSVALTSRYPTDRWTWPLVYCSLTTAFGSAFMIGYSFRTTRLTDFISFLVPKPKFNFSITEFEMPTFLEAGQTEPTLKSNFNNTGLEIPTVSKDFQAFIKYCTYIYLLFQLLGILCFAKALGDKFGRKRVLLGCSAGGLLATIIEWAVQPSPGLPVPALFSQALLGFSSGVALIIGPALLIEIAPCSHKGACGTLFELFFLLGNTLSLFFDVDLFQLNNYFLFPVFSFSVYVVQSILLLFIVESPHWLFQQGSFEKAVESLKRLRSVDELTLGQEIQELKTSCQKTATPLKNLAKFFGVGALLSLVYTMTGKDILLEFVSSDVQLDSFYHRLQSICCIIASLLCTLSCLLLVDRVGRRPLVIAGLVGTTSSLVCLIALIVEQVEPEKYKMCSFAFIIFFSLGPGPIAPFMVAEMTDASSRLRAMSFAQAIGYLIHFIWQAAVAYKAVRLDNAPPFTLAIIFTVISFIMLVLLGIFLRETGGSSMMNGKKIVWSISLESKRSSNTTEIIEIGPEDLENADGACDSSPKSKWPQTTS